MLGIENKPWAGQQFNQLPDYRAEIEIRARAVEKIPVLIFLSDQEEKTAKGDVVRMPYFAVDGPSLDPILNEVHDRVRAQRCYNFVSEFLQYIKLQSGREPCRKNRDEPYVQAVEVEFDGEQRKRQAIAAVTLSTIETVLPYCERSWPLLVRYIGEGLHSCR